MLINSLNNQHLNIFLFDCFYMYTQRISHSYGSGSVEYSAKKAWFDSRTPGKFSLSLTPEVATD